MEKYAKERGLEPLPYSHMEELIWNEYRRVIRIYDGKKKSKLIELEPLTLYTIGARKSGPEISKVSDYYGEHEIKIMQPVTPLTEAENAILWEEFKKLDPTKYQYGKLIDWLLYNKWGWQLAKEGPGKNICYELGARFSNAIGRWQGKDIDYATPYDFIVNKNYRIYEP